MRPKKERQRAKFTDDDMKMAVHAVMKGGISVRKSAQYYNIKFQTLARYVKICKEDPDKPMQMSPNYSNRKVFTEKEEAALAQYLIRCSQMAFGLPKKDFLALVLSFAEKNQKKIPKSWADNKAAGEDWFKGFIRRNPTVSLRKPEACSLSRLTSFNKHNVGVFFDNLETIKERWPELFTNGHRIWNLDETSTCTVQAPKNVLAERGVKQVYKATSGERGITVTSCFIVSASGTCLPPAMVFPRVYFKDHMLTGCIPGTLGLANPSGWMTSTLFSKVLDHFIQHTNSSQENHQLLIMDNHESHVSSAVIEKAVDNGVILLTLPPHCSNRLQPLDVSVYSPFKTAYNGECDSLMKQQPGVPIDIYKIASIVHKAADEAMTPKNIKSGFSKSGIYPFNRHIFTDGDFLGSYVTDRPVENASESVSTSQNIPDNSESSPTTQALLPRPTNGNEPDASSSLDAGVNETAQSTYQLPGKQFILPEDIVAFPKAAPRKANRQKREKGRSKIVTDTPEKNFVIKKENEKADKANKSSKPKKPSKKSNQSKKVKNLLEANGETFEKTVCTRKNKRQISIEEEINENCKGLAKKKKSSKENSKFVEQKSVSRNLQFDNY